MNFAVSLWHLVQEDRLVRWATYATAADLLVRDRVGRRCASWWSAWRSSAVVLWWLRRQRERRGWFQEREIDIDLL